MTRTAPLMGLVLLLLLGACGSGDGTSAFGGTDDPTPTVVDDDPTAEGDTTDEADTAQSADPEPTASPTAVPTPVPVATPTVAPKPTLTPVPVAPTATPVPAPAPPNPLDDIVAGDCVRGLGSGESLTEVACDAANAEGRVLRAARSADIACPNADLTISQTSTAAGATSQYGFCIDRLVTLASLFGDIDRRCQPADLDDGEVDSTICTRRNHSIFFVRIERGLGPRAYLDGFQWDSPPERFGEWSLGDTTCGSIFLGRNDGAILLVSTFDRAPYAVWHVSSELSVDRLADQLSFSLDSSLCPAG